MWLMWMLILAGYEPPEAKRVLPVELTYYGSVHSVQAMTKVKQLFREQDILLSVTWTNLVGITPEKYEDMDGYWNWTYLVRDSYQEDEGSIFINLHSGPAATPFGLARLGLSTCGEPVYAGVRGSETEMYGSTVDEYVGVLMHELGHHFCLPHNNRTDSALGTNPAVITLSKDEWTFIKMRIDYD